MNKVISVYTPGVTARIEMFTLDEEELRQFVIYTYYNEHEEPLYVGCSKSFYDAHYFNSARLAFFDQVKYVGFVFMNDEANMKESKKYYIRARQPKHGRSKHLDLPYLKGCDVYSDDLVVSREEMEQRWAEWLGDDDGEGDELLAEIDAEWEAEKTAWPDKVKSVVRIKERDLTERELNYVMAWWDLGVDEHEMKKAYETTVIRMGKLSWEYMHALLKRWKE